jgi:hypothetical protein
VYVRKKGRPPFAGEWATVVRREVLRTGVPLAPERLYYFPSLVTAG